MSVSPQTSSSSTKRRLEDATQPLNKKQRVEDDVHVKVDAALQSIESAYESLYESLHDNEGTISTTNQSRLEEFQNRMASVIKYNKVKKTELAYRQTVGEQIKRLCDKVDFAAAIVKGLRFFKDECKSEFNDDWNQNQDFSTCTADIALKRRAPSPTYIRMMRELLNEHTLTDMISDIISVFCSNDVIWYRIDSHDNSTDTYQQFESSGFQQLSADVDDLFRSPMFYKPRDEYKIGNVDDIEKQLIEDTDEYEDDEEHKHRYGREDEWKYAVDEMRRDLDESAMSKLTDLEVKRFFIDVYRVLFDREWQKPKEFEWILEGTSIEKYS